MNLTEGQIVSYIIGMLVCILFSAFFSATETAFSSFNRTRLKTLAEDGSKRAKLVLDLAAKYDRLISTILIGNNIVNIAVASLGTVLFVSFYGDIGATISTVLVTVVVLIFGEISPKSIAKDFPEKFSMFAAPIIQLFIWVLYPLNFLFGMWKKFINLFFKPKNDDKMSQAELLMLVEEVQEDGSIDKNEGNLLRNAIEFTDLKAEEILTHRVDLEALPITASKKEIAKMFSTTKFSRLLVYKDDIDDIVGVLHLKDFYTVDGITDKPLDKIITPPIFIHRSEKISNLLKLLQSNKSHIAVVLDEYGGTLGIVTMEDILEELVGEIWDEHDDVTEQFKELSANKYLVDCDVSIDDFARFFDIDVESESSTVNGWITEKLDKIPVKGDSFVEENLKITVSDTDAHRVKFAVAERIPEKEEDDEENAR